MNIKEINKIIENFRLKMRETFPHNRDELDPDVSYDKEEVIACMTIKKCPIKGIKIIIGAGAFDNYQTLTIDVYFSRDLLGWYTKFKDESPIEASIREEFTDWKFNQLVNDPD